MKDIRHTILWVVFGFSLVMLWDQWQIHNGKKPTFFPSVPQTSAPVPAPSPVSSDNNPSAAVAINTLQNPAAAAVQGTPPQRFDVETDVLKLQFSSQGGDLVRAELLKHKDANHPGSNIVLMDDSKERVYLAQSGLISDRPDAFLPTHITSTTFSGKTSLKESENELQLQFESAPIGEVKLIKTYTLTRGSYAIAVRHDIVNLSSNTIAPRLYVQLVRDGKKPEGESQVYTTFTGPVVFTNQKKYQKIDFEDVAKNKADFEKQSEKGFVGMVQHYFATAWIFPDGQIRDYSIEKKDIEKSVQDCCYRIAMKTTPLEIKTKQSKALEAKLFVGPQEEKILESTYPGLEFVKDYGWLTILSKPLYWLLYELYRIIGNWGWAIVALVVVLKIAFYWLNSQAYKSMGKMKAINPKIMEMREKLKDNPQLMQTEMMKIYREEKVNPLGGCLPIAVQMPFFIALYWVLLSSVEMRNAPWIGWVHDLSAPDTAFGVWFGVPIGLLPILMTATSVFQTWLNPTPPDPIQAKMMWFMPLAFSVMFFFFPAGLVLYWLSNNILSIAQQWMINKQLGVMK